jgi:hypothetical protein
MSMTSAELQEKLEAAEQKVEKIKGTIEKHKKQAEKKLTIIHKAGCNENDKFSYRQTEMYWTICDYESKLNDIKSAERKLKDAEIIVRNWKEKLEKEKAKNEVERIPVIEEFLEAWKIKSIEWHKQAYIQYIQYLQDLREKKKILEQWKKENNLEHSWRYSEEEKEKVLEKEKELNIDSETIAFSMGMRFNSLIVKMYGLYKDNQQEREILLEKEVEREKNDKRQLFILRVKGITGTVQDASGLSIGGNGEINGIVIGEKGKAKVNTISAGGYNIQCWHFRVLVKEV